MTICSWQKKYSTCCLLNCKFVPGQNYIAVTATDGHVAFFSIPYFAENAKAPSEATPNGIEVEGQPYGMLDLKSKFQIHQSSIKCMEMITISGTQSLSLL
jgi:hypothetical protein